MAKLTKQEQSRIGRKSRRKGKVFEREIAGRFREWFGTDWQTTRNSGRTDLPGDIYCVDRQTKICIECKHRKKWTTSDILKGNETYKKALLAVVNNWEPERNQYPGLLVFRKDEFGIWVAAYGVRIEKIFGFFTTSVKGPDCVEWVLIKPDQTISCEAMDVLF